MLHAPVSAYDALRDLTRTTMGGPGESYACESEDGVPQDRYVALGFGSMQTDWPEGGPLDTMLRFEPSRDGRFEASVVFSLEYAPLRPLAPRYEFDR
jgi:hypothetical protein